LYDWIGTCSCANLENSQVELMRDIRNDELTSKEAKFSFGVAKASRGRLLRLG
jgi:hypothetical protein